MSREYPRFELDVASQVEAIRDVVQIGENLLHALDVAACARISIPEPRPADARARLEYAHAPSDLAHLVDQVETGETGAYPDHVEVVLLIHGMRFLYAGPAAPPYRALLEMN
jgi:hypothetical protein